MEMFGVFIVSKGKCDWVWHVQPQVDLSMIPKLFNLRNFSLEIRCIPSFIVVRNGFTSVAIPWNEIVPFLKQSCNFYLSTFFPIALKLSAFILAHIFSILCHCHFNSGCINYKKTTDGKKCTRQFTKSMIVHKTALRMATIECIQQFQIR